MIDLLTIGIICFVILTIIIMVSLRRVPEADEAVVITQQGDMKVLSGHADHRYTAKYVDEEYEEKEETKVRRVINKVPHNQTAYYAIPSWVPIVGRQIQKMPLNMMEISVSDFEAWDNERARFVVDVKAFVSVKDVIVAAKRFPGGIDKLIEQVSAVIQGATREVTTQQPIRQILTDRKGIRQLTNEKVEDSISEWGLDLNDFEILDFKDAPKSSVITDISSIKHAEINSEARQKNATQHKLARLKEAEADQEAKNRELERDESIGKREQARNQNIAKEEQKAKAESMEVLKIQQVRQAAIEKEARIERAEGARQAVIKEQEGIAEGKKKVLFAEAEGLSKKADAMKKINDSAKEVRRIEKDEKIGVELARAYQKADIKVIQTGDKPKSLLDLASSADGGASLGAAMASLNATNPELGKQISKLINKFSEKEKK